ncbi:MAG: class I SAM-dependent methyltransferase [Marinobacter sp.]|uniref:class I SAM-dependent methyltransferase n=1 Tax=Marinobacter sp. TaxID=50741 RepID=UPI00349FDC2F
MSSPSSPALAVGCSPLAEHQSVRQVADALQLPFLGIVKPRNVLNFGVLLFADESGLSLQVTGPKAPGPVRAEFASGKAGYRLEHGGGTGQLIARAIGLQKTRMTLHVLDATAGLGQDAFVLAGLGCRMTLMERSPVIQALLADGLARGRLNDSVAPVIERMRLRSEDSIHWLAGGDGEVADVIYLDPMFPHRDKAALVKKEMRVFRALVGDDEDAPELLAAALTGARYRVVVKRPRKAPSIEGPRPAIQIEGKSSRYDIYPVKALPVSTTGQ